MLKRLMLQRRKNRYVAFCACFLMVVIFVSGCDISSKSNPAGHCKKRHPSPTSECLKPALVPIGDQKVMLGSSLEIKISATDPDPDSVLTFSAETIDGPPKVSFDPQTQMLTWNTDRDDLMDQEPSSVKFQVCDNCPTGPLCAEEIVTFDTFLPLEEYYGDYSSNMMFDDIESGRVTGINFSFADESKKELFVQAWSKCDTSDDCDWGRVAAEYNNANGVVTAQFQLDWGTSTLQIKKDSIQAVHIWVIESRDYTEEDGREDATYEYPLVNF